MTRTRGTSIYVRAIELSRRVPLGVAASILAVAVAISLPGFAGDVLVGPDPFRW
jgi:hypothetical protein